MKSEGNTSDMRPMGHLWSFGTTKVAWEERMDSVVNRMNELDSNQNLYSEEQLESKTGDSVRFNVSTSALDEQIIDALNEYIRPAVESDGGSIDFVEFKDGIVKVALRGACSGCPSSTVTLKQGIEGLLCRMFPEVKEVESVSL